MVETIMWRVKTLQLHIKHSKVLYCLKKSLFHSHCGRDTSCSSAGHIYQLYFLFTSTSRHHNQWDTSQQTKMSLGWRCCWRRAAVWWLLLNERSGNGRSRHAAGQTVRTADLRAHYQFGRISHQIFTCEDFCLICVFLCRDTCWLTSPTVFFIIGHEW